MTDMTSKNRPAGAGAPTVEGQAPIEGIEAALQGLAPELRGVIELAPGENSLAQERGERPQVRENPGVGGI